MGMNLKTWAMALGYVGGFLTILALSGTLGKYAALAGAIGAAMTATGVHIASDTSAGHPDGAGTTHAQADQALQAQEVASAPK
jgi:hypothetical protein